MYYVHLVQSPEPLNEIGPLITPISWKEDWGLEKWFAQECSAGFPQFLPYGRYQECAFSPFSTEITVYGCATWAPHKSGWQNKVWNEIRPCHKPDIAFTTPPSPCGTSGKESACQCRRCKRRGFNPWLGKIPEKRMAINSSILVWRIPQTEKPGRLQSLGSQRVGHDWETERQHCSP